MDYTVISVLFIKQKGIISVVLDKDIPYCVNYLMIINGKAYECGYVFACGLSARNNSTYIKANSSVIKEGMTVQLVLKDQWNKPYTPLT